MTQPRSHSRKQSKQDSDTNLSEIPNLWHGTPRINRQHCRVFLFFALPTFQHTSTSPPMVIARWLVQCSLSHLGVIFSKFLYKSFFSEGGKASAFLGAFPGWYTFFMVSLVWGVVNQETLAEMDRFLSQQLRECFLLCLSWPAMQ